MPTRKLAYFVLLAAAMLIPAVSHAGTIYTYTVSGCSENCGAGPFGTVTLTQVNPAEVDIRVELASGVKFVSTSDKHPAFAWNVAGSGISINVLTPGFVIGDSDTSMDVHSANFGLFEYSIVCQACGNGGSNAQSGPLNLALSRPGGLTIADFIPTDNYYFTSDVFANGTTGNVGALAAPQPAPEPATWFLTGTALIGFVRFLRRRRGDA